MLRSGLLASAAFRRRDWPAVETATDALVSDYPTHYYYYWYRGFAAYQRGDRDGAIRALEIYTRYAKDEEPYAEATALLERLKSQGLDVK